MNTRHTGQDRVIQQLMALMVDSVNYEELARSIVEMFAQLFEADLCTLWRRVQQDSEDKLILSASLGIERKPGDIVPTYSLDWQATSNKHIDGVTAWIAIRRQVCLANSYYELRSDESKPWYGSHRGSWDHYQFKGRADKNFKCLLGLPIIYSTVEGKDEVIGVLKVEAKRTPSGFSLEDQSLAERFIPFMAIALQTMAVREQHEGHRQNVLRSLTGALLRGDPATYYEQVVNTTAELLRADVCSLWLANDERTKLQLAANFGVREKTSVPEYPLNWDAEKDIDIEGLTPWVAIRKQPFFGEKHEDLKAHPAWRGRWDDVQWHRRVESEFGCLYAVPLLDARRDAIGVLKIENRSGEPKFDAVDRATFDLMAEFIALAIELNSRLRSDIVFDFFHLLKQPVANAVMAFASLRRELSRREPRPEHIETRLKMMAMNLDSVRDWVTNVYGLATAREAPFEETTEIPLRLILFNVTTEIQMLFPEFSCNLDDVANVVLILTPLQVKKVEAILFNILENSFKHTDESRDIRAEVRRENGHVLLAISDNGSGIAPEDLPRVFEPFFTRQAGIWPASMGLGLATVDRLLKEFGWDRKIESRVNVGTRFSIFITREHIK